MMFINSSGGDIAGTLDGSYYKGQGIRQGIEREYIMVSDDGSGIDSAECREDRWEDISHSDGKSRNRGGAVTNLSFDGDRQ